MSNNLIQHLPNTSRLVAEEIFFQQLLVITANEEDAQEIQNIIDELKKGDPTQRELEVHDWNILACSEQL